MATTVYLARKAPHRAKFQDPDFTAKGEPRASIHLESLDTLWINTGTLCNIACRNCYIESSPRNDRLAYFSYSDALRLYDEIAYLGLTTRKIGFTGGEPFLNEELLPMAEEALGRGFDVLILTNAMRPMQRPSARSALLRLKDRHGDRLSLRVSLDHFKPEIHDRERGPGSWAVAVSGIDWLAGSGFRVSIAGRSFSGQSEAFVRAGYGKLFAAHAWPLDPDSSLILFPEVGRDLDLPEVSVNCWSRLSNRPSDIMCARGRMAVRRRGENQISIVPCTLLPYETAFDMGPSLEAAGRAHGGNFEHGAVKLNHPYCAEFCVLGGGHCTG